jgi:hypothetical protein
MWAGSGDKNVERLSGDVRGEQQERDADDTKRAPLALDVVNLLQLPDDDEGGDDLDERPNPASATERSSNAATSTTGPAARGAVYSGALAG